MRLSSEKNDSSTFYQLEWNRLDLVLVFTGGIPHTHTHTHTPYIIVFIRTKSPSSKIIVIEAIEYQQYALNPKVCSWRRGGDVAVLTKEGFTSSTSRTTPKSFVKERKLTYLLRILCLKRRDLPQFKNISVRTHVQWNSEI